MIKPPNTVPKPPTSKIHNRTVRSLGNAAYFEARAAELHNRSVLRTEIKRRRKTKGRQRVTGQPASSISSPAASTPSTSKSAVSNSAKSKSAKSKSSRAAAAKKRRGASPFRSPTLTLPAT